MIEIESNKEAWSKISEDHYHYFKTAISGGKYQLNHYIQEEVGDLSGKKIIHLQCNTGADSLILAKTAQSVMGVDLVPENVFFARKLADELNYNNVEFIESDIMTLASIHSDKYDVVFTSEGVLGWLPDLNIWAQTIRGLLKDGGYLYVFDTHPMFLSFDEGKLEKEIFEIKYPYFGKTPDIDNCIGGYASEIKAGVKAYFWMHTISDIINALTSTGLHIEYFNEYTEAYCDWGNMQVSEKKGLYEYCYNTDKYPMSFSLKASVYQTK
ncbi:class I SAM-dependent methyltransferase [Cellulosilyticum lentocellum]|uniref:Methyltransferase type 11 n=1 Tax=Cellulosilyticum lentocellum (strain ATCC 49066 / DSM 5427 / NCIMB 11756 / RHM5) TaxID=642492 RepID=F2JKG9_CELLD|nr:methyltransferase domain-containing protein [Cellulosilyticum lentocellum]ADZ82129.1 Methyltransferase type 11 [Cellulosilyticum lentocellum DSM 5427]